MSKLKIVEKQVKDLIPYINNSRIHSDDQITQIAASIKEFGWTNPILLDGANGIIAGHGRLLAAKKLGFQEVPTIELSDLTEAQKKALTIADNKISANAEWDNEMLALEISGLREINYDLTILGFRFDELIAMQPIEEEQTEKEEPKEVNYAIQYNLVFEDEEQQNSWYGFLKYLKMIYPSEETLGARLQKYIEDNNLAEA